jgi:hypothetical protein
MKNINNNTNNSESKLPNQTKQYQYGKDGIVKRSIQDKSFNTSNQVKPKQLINQANNEQSTQNQKMLTLGAIGRSNSEKRLQTLNELNNEKRLQKEKLSLDSNLKKSNFKPSYKNENLNQKKLGEYNAKSEGSLITANNKQSNMYHVPPNNENKDKILVKKKKKPTRTDSRSDHMIPNRSRSVTNGRNSPRFKSPSLESASFHNKIDETNNLFDLVIVLKTFLKQIEKSYSLDNLYEYLKTNVKYNGYRNFTLDSLEAYLGNSQRASNMSIHDTKSLPNSQLQLIHPIQPHQQQSTQTNGLKNRSIGQFKKPSHNIFANSNNQLTQSNQYYDLNGRNANKKPLDHLFEHMRQFKNIFQVIQVDLLNRILYNSYETRFNLAPSNVIQNLHDNHDNSENNFSKQFANKDFKRLRKYHQKLYDLNEKLFVLINDPTNCDLKMLSFNSNLPIKYEYYKHGEYILRLTGDIIYKMRHCLKLSEKYYQLNFKLNGDDFVSYLNESNITYPQSQSTLSSYPYIDEADKHTENNADDDGDEDDDDNNSLVEPQDSVLRRIKRKKMSERVSNTTDSIKKLKQNYRLLDDVDIGPYADYNNHNTNEDQNDQNLLKQDTHDSFIQDTDCSSLISEESTVYFTENNVVVRKHEKPIEEKKTNSKKDFYEPVKKQHNQAKLVDEYKNVQTQIESTSILIKDLNQYMQSLIQRAERCVKLEEQLKFDHDLIKKTEKSLKGLKSEMSTSTNLADNTNNELFRLNLKKQLDYLQYRFRLNLQDYNIEQICAPEIGTAISDTQYKLSYLNNRLKELNKKLFYIESHLSEVYLLEKKQLDDKPFLYKQQQQQQNQQLKLSKLINNKSKLLPPIKQQAYLNSISNQQIYLPLTQKYK